MHKGLRAVRFHPEHPGRESHVPGPALEMQMLRSHAIERPGQPVRPGIAHEIAGSRARRPFVEGKGSAALQDAVIGQKQDVVSEGEGIARIGARVDDRQGQLVEQCCQFHLERFAQLVVEVHEGLVHDQNVGTFGQRPANGYPLLLTAGELLRSTLEKCFEFEFPRQVPHGLVDVGRRRALSFKGRGDVLVDAPARVVDEGLIDEGDAPLAGTDAREALPIEADLSRRGRLETGKRAREQRFSRVIPAEDHGDAPRLEAVAHGRGAGLQHQGMKL